MLKTYLQNGVKNLGHNKDNQNPNSQFLKSCTRINLGQHKDNQNPNSQY